MFYWIVDWFYGSYSGPARNAPNSGHDIKKFIENKPPEVTLISPEDINNVIQKLNKVPEIEKSSFSATPLMTEFNNVFSMGYKQYFEEKKLKKMNLNK